jgi:hypothetical protein
MITVLIHGPVKSYGIGPNKNVDGWECTESIIANAWNAKNLNLEVYLSIAINSSINKVPTQNLIDCGQKQTFFYDSSQIAEPDNRIKQRMGLSAALTQMKAQSVVSYVLIIRTDMLMPQSFWVWVEGLEKNLRFRDSPLFYCSELNAEPFYIGDFIFLSTIERLEKMLGNLLLNPRALIHPISNCELGLSLLKNNLPLPNVGRVNVFKFLHRFFKLRESWGELAQSIGTPPKDVYSQIEWRGVPMWGIFDLNSFEFKNPREQLVIESRIFRLILSYNYFSSIYHLAEGKSISASIFLKSRYLLITLKNRVKS